MNRRLWDHAPEPVREGMPHDRELGPVPTLPNRYVLVPDPLITAFARDPLAVGVYVAVARLVLAAKGAVALAARDLAVWMGSSRDADRAAIMRRIVKLTEGGWLVIERSAATKHRLLPTWGRDQQGRVRPWRMDLSDSGRPASLRGRRLPLSLLDDYLGRLDPQPGRGRALVSRYFTRPLLDLVDIGVYAIGLRVEVTPTPRLRHMRLYGPAGMLPPDPQSLLAQAAAGTLTRLDSETEIPVQLTIQGYARLGIPAPGTTAQNASSPDHQGGSRDGSQDGSVSGSLPAPSEQRMLSLQDEQNDVDTRPRPMIAWDVGMSHESINHPPPTDGGVAGRGCSAEDAFGLIDRTEAGRQVVVHGQQGPLVETVAGIAPSLAREVIAGHAALNPVRPIWDGEWHELLALQEAFGARQLLIWQARAKRAPTERPRGITPAYYYACAAHPAGLFERPTPCRRAAGPLKRDGIAAPMPALRHLDPACDALLRAMGVRERQQLAAVPYDRILAWQQALAHPGMAAQFVTPVGFAVAQMRRGNPPPTTQELDRWAEGRSWKGARAGMERYIAAPVSDADALRQEHELEVQVRAIAPPDADLVELCALARWLEAGVSATTSQDSLRSNPAARTP